MSEVPLDTLTHADFESHLGERVTIHAAGAGSLAGELWEVHPAPYPASTPGKRQAFSVLFRGPLTPVLPQAIYRVESDSMGAMELFLVPVGPRDGGMQYEAIFS